MPTDLNLPGNLRLLADRLDDTPATGQASRAMGDASTALRDAAREIDRLRSGAAAGATTPEFASDLRSAARTVRGSSWPLEMGEWADKLADRLDRYATAGATTVAPPAPTDVAELLNRIAAGRVEYADTGNERLQEVIRHEAAVLDHIADALAGRCTWADLVASYVPSRHWPEFGEHDPLPAAGSSPAGTPQTEEGS